MSEDRQLLAEFCRNGSEIAFRRLVERHLGLVYSTAMRVVNGDAHLAQDIAQTVFSNLARKACSLSAHVVLAGWLHRDTHFTALEFLRKERRRMAREREAATMYAIESSGEGVDWSRLSPILDEILNELEEEDRHVLLLRFFEEQNFAEVGSTIGLSEDTTRKRVSRALDKLRHALFSRGITTTTSALATILTSRGVETVPSGLSAQFARSALAATGTATTSTAGILTLLTSAKASTLIMACVVLLLAGATVLKFSMPVFDEINQTTTVPKIEAPRPADASNFSLLVARGIGQARSENGLKLAAALARIREVLHDPKPTPRWPNPAMEEAIAALGDNREAAVPILRKALRDTDEKVGDRAADALGQLGFAAREAVPDIIQKLRSSDTGMGPSLLVRALEIIAPSPEIAPDLAQMLRDHPQTRLQIIALLSTPIWGDPAKVADAVNAATRPLLQDEDLETRLTGALCLSTMFKVRADSDVINEVVKIAMEGIKSGNEDFRSFGLSVLQDASETQEHLGTNTAEAIPPLIDIANNGNAKDQQARALKLLNAIQPELVAANPAMSSFLRTDEQDLAFARKVNGWDGTNIAERFFTMAAQQERARLQASHSKMPLPPLPRSHMSVPELIEGLKQHPGAVVAIAQALATLGPEARVALPALKAALPGLTAQSAASGVDMIHANFNREALANAIQQIAPDQPKVLFTYSDTQFVLDVFDDPAFKSDSHYRKALHSAMILVWPVNGSPLEMTPEQMHLFLDSLKTNDLTAYDAVAAKVEIVDPQFFK